MGRQQEQSEGETVQAPESGGSQAAADEENDLFWGLDDIPGSFSVLLLHSMIVCVYAVNSLILFALQWKQRVS